jgi:RNA polymerase sigma factor (sigma-70 family)
VAKRPRSGLREEPAFDKLLEDYAHLIFTKVRAFDHEKFGIDRDDLLQEIRLRIWRLCDSRRAAIRNMRAYIAKVVFSTVLKEIEKERLQRRIVDSQSSGISSLPPEGRNHPGGNRRLRDEFLAALGRLPERQSGVIRLRLQGFTLKEIALLKGYTLAKTRHLYYRGQEELKKIVRIEGGTQ